MSDPQYDAKFGEVYRGARRGTEDLIVMVISCVTRQSDFRDYITTYLAGGNRGDLQRWALYREQWERVDA